MKQFAWKHMGDMDYFKNGGVWVRQQDSEIYDFVEVKNIDGENIQISSGTVFIDDFWSPEDSVFKFADIKETDKLEFIRSTIDLSGSEEFCSDPNFTTERRTVDAYLKSHGIPI